jgi:lactaldehyde dehydrogenase/glycolaldehyde dehydrogenase
MEGTNVTTQMAVNIPPPEMYIGGAWVTAEQTRPVLNPATEEVIGEVPEGDLTHVERALEAAKAAQREWARRSYVERAAVVRAVVALIRERAEELARLVVAEQGKTITEARGEIGGTAGFFEYYTSFERGHIGSMFAPDARGEQIISRLVPYGVVVGIIPWNYPAALFARKVGPAIMAGNSIVLKPHEDTPLAALALARLCEDAGVPAGVVNVVTGAGRVVGDALVRNPLTDLVTVTGSVRAGREIIAASAENITVVSLELGGKAPFIVMDDADVDAAVQGAFEARFWNCGQVCTCNERTYVQAGVYDEFLERFVSKAKALKIGDPMREDTQMGPKVNKPEVDKVQAFVDGAVKQGAEVVLGGGRPDGPEFDKGYWFSPTVLTNVANDWDIVQQEVFGPVLPVQSFADFDEAVALANDTRYGLTSYIYTNNFRTAMRAVDALHSGEVYINKIGPEQLQGFHGGYGLSGLGGDDGPYGFERYHRRKTVYLKYDDGAGPDDGAALPPQ